MIYDDGVEKVSGGGLTCPCGGPISKVALKGGRERWKCLACLRYEIMKPKEEATKKHGDWRIGMERDHAISARLGKDY